MQEQFLDIENVFQEDRQIAQHYECPLCLGIAMKPVFTCAQCGVLYCKKCIDENGFTAEQNCCGCNEPGKRFLMNHHPGLQAIRFQCKNKGCDTVKPYTEILQHQASCNKGKGVQICVHCSLALNQLHCCEGHLQDQLFAANNLLLEHVFANYLGSYQSSSGVVLLKKGQGEYYNLAIGKESVECFPFVDFMEKKVVLNGDSASGEVQACFYLKLKGQQSMEL